MTTNCNHSDVDKLSDDEACRRLMEFLHGDDAKAMTEALLRHGTDEVTDTSITPDIEAAFVAFTNEMSSRQNRSSNREEVRPLEKQKWSLFEGLRELCSNTIAQMRSIMFPKRVAMAIISATCIALIVVAVAWPVGDELRRHAGLLLGSMRPAEDAQRENKLPSTTLSGGGNTLTFYGWSNDDIVATNLEEVLPSRDSNLSLEVDAAGQVRGTVKSLDGRSSWQVTGFVDADEITIVRKSGSQNEHRATSAIRVTKQPNSETYLGHILGKNCKTGEIIVCPYMLTKGQESDDDRWSKKLGHKALCHIQEPVPEMVCG